MNKEDIFSLIEKTQKSVSRHYGDVKIFEFECGCEVLTVIDKQRYTVFKEICGDHRKDYEEKIGRDVLDSIALKPR